MAITCPGVSFTLCFVSFNGAMAIDVEGDEDDGASVDGEPLDRRERALNAMDELLNDRAEEKSTSKNRNFVLIDVKKKSIVGN